MYKFFVNSEQIIDGKITILGTDVNHITNVLRLKIEEQIQICDIDTSINYIVEIENYNKEQVICNIIEEIESKVESNIKLDIYQGLPKADKMELIIQKRTELGVSKIIPVAMDRCIVKLNGKDEQKKIERWQKIAEVAAKQSKRDKIPEIEQIKTIKQICEKVEEYDCFIIAYEEEKELTLKQVLKKITRNEELKIGVLIGPEGGIDEKEIKELEKYNVKIVTLGNRILRTETAPISITSIILYELEGEE